MAKVVFTAGRVSGFQCEPDKAQAFLWDVTAPGLGLRATPAGKPAYVFQSRYQDKTIRLTIGSPDVWSIEQARDKAKALQRLIDDGKDPRDLKRDALAETERRAAALVAEATAAIAKEVTEAREAVTVGEVWAVYVAERAKHWGVLHTNDHDRLTRAGGVKSTRGTRGRGVTIAGPLHPLMAVPLRDLTAPAIEAWAELEAQTRPTAARLAWRLLKVFLGWCAEKPAYAALLPTKNPAKTKKTREALGKPGTKSDVLQREQLAAWFTAVQQIGNPAIAAYLQLLLLTGARPGEVLALRWDDVNTQWKGIQIRDKVEGTREIPATPYMLHLLAALPRRTFKDPATGEQVSSPWVFASPNSATGYITEPNSPHTRACKAAGIEGLTLHGLRRSFASLTEWLETPAGVVAQIQGHKPSATAEKHYKVRPLELLRVHHKRIEAWILKQAGIVFDAKAAPGALRVVAG